MTKIYFELKLTSFSALPYTPAFQQLFDAIDQASSKIWDGNALLDPCEPLPFSASGDEAILRLLCTETDSFSYFPAPCAIEYTFLGRTVRFSLKPGTSFANAKCAFALILAVLTSPQASFVLHGDHLCIADWDGLCRFDTPYTQKLRKDLEKKRSLSSNIRYLQQEAERLHAMQMDLRRKNAKSYIRKKGEWTPRDSARLHHAMHKSNAYKAAQHALDSIDKECRTYALQVMELSHSTSIVSCTLPRLMHYAIAQTLNDAEGFDELFAHLIAGDLDGAKSVISGALADKWINQSLQLKLEWIYAHILMCAAEGSFNEKTLAQIMPLFQNISIMHIETQFDDCVELLDACLSELIALCMDAGIATALMDVLRLYSALYDPASGPFAQPTNLYLYACIGGAGDAIQMNADLANLYDLDTALDTLYTLRDFDSIDPQTRPYAILAACSLIAMIGPDYFGDLKPVLDRLMAYVAEDLFGEDSLEPWKLHCTLVLFNSMLMLIENEAEILSVDESLQWLSAIRSSLSMRTRRMGWSHPEELRILILCTLILCDFTGDPHEGLAIPQILRDAQSQLPGVMDMMSMFGLNGYIEMMSQTGISPSVENDPFEAFSSVMLRAVSGMSDDELDQMAEILCASAEQLVDWSFFDTARVVLNKMYKLIETMPQQELLPPDFGSWQAAKDPFDTTDMRFPGDLGSSSSWSERPVNPSIDWSESESSLDSAYDYPPFATEFNPAEDPAFSDIYPADSPEGFDADFGSGYDTPYSSSQNPSDLLEPDFMMDNLPEGGDSAPVQDPLRTLIHVFGKYIELCPIGHEHASFMTMLMRGSDLARTLYLEDESAFYYALCTWTAAIDRMIDHGLKEPALIAMNKALEILDHAQNMDIALHLRSALQQKAWDQMLGVYSTLGGDYIEKGRALANQIISDTDLHNLQLYTQEDLLVVLQAVSFLLRHETSPEQFAAYISMLELLKRPALQAEAGSPLMLRFLNVCTDGLKSAYKIADANAAAFFKQSQKELFPDLPPFVEMALGTDTEAMLELCQELKMELPLLMKYPLMALFTDINVTYPCPDPDWKELEQKLCGTLNGSPVEDWQDLFIALSGNLERIYTTVDFVQLALREYDYLEAQSMIPQLESLTGKNLSRLKLRMDLFDCIGTELENESDDPDARLKREEYLLNLHQARTALDAHGDQDPNEPDVLLLSYFVDCLFAFHYITNSNVFMSRRYLDILSRKISILPDAFSSTAARALLYLRLGFIAYRPGCLANTDTPESIEQAYSLWQSIEEPLINRLDLMLLSAVLNAIADAAEAVFEECGLNAASPDNLSKHFHQLQKWQEELRELLADNTKSA